MPDPRDVPDLLHRIAIDDDAAPVAIFAVRSTTRRLPEPADVGEEDTAMILYTSGTTGRPKGAMLAHCNIIHSAMVFDACMDLTAADRSIAAVPLAHVTGVVANITTMVRCAGTLIIVAEFKAAEYLKIAARERVTHTVMVPAMYNLCLLQPDFDSYDLSSLADRRFRRRADADRDHRKAGDQDSRPEADQRLRRDRDDLAFDHHAAAN